MSSTTSLKLPDDLKAQAAAAAQRLGITPHAFMVGAIRQAAAAAEERARWLAQAKAGRKATLKEGTAYDAEDVHDYLRALVAAKPATRPKAKRWRG